MIAVGPMLAAIGVAINVFAYAVTGSALNLAAGVFCLLCFLICLAIVATER